MIHSEHQIDYFRHDIMSTPHPYPQTDPQSTPKTRTPPPEHHNTYTPTSNPHQPLTKSINTSSTPPTHH